VAESNLRNAIKVADKLYKVDREEIVGEYTAEEARKGIK